MLRTLGTGQLGRGDEGATARQLHCPLIRCDGFLDELGLYLFVFRGVLGEEVVVRSLIRRENHATDVTALAPCCRWAMPPSVFIPDPVPTVASWEEGVLEVGLLVVG